MPCFVTNEPSSQDLNEYFLAGDLQWEMFEHKDFKGRSTVLSMGEFYDTSLLPFGNNDLSSVHRVGTLNENMEKIRQEISNARGIGTELYQLVFVSSLV